MPWQMTEDGKNIVIGEAGNPVWIPEDVPEGEKPTPVEVDWSSALGTISRLNDEGKQRRETNEQLSTTLEDLNKKLKAYGDLDPEKAREAVTKLKNIDQGSLLTADKVDEFKQSILVAAEADKNQVVGELQEHIKQIEEQLQGSKQKFDKLVISNSFANSKFVNDLKLPVEMVESFFSKNFKIEDSKLIGYMGDAKINSRKRPGETASFDEAISIIVENYPEKDKLFPGNPGGGGSGGGERGQSAATANEVKGMSLAEYESAKSAGRI